MANESADLNGLCVLVVEDSPLFAEVICDRLQDCGCVVGPAGRVQHALTLAREARLEGALLDVNLAGEFSLPGQDRVDNLMKAHS